MLKNILRTTKCGNLTPLSILVDDDNRININKRIITRSRHQGLEVSVLTNSASQINGGVLKPVFWHLLEVLW